MRNNIEQIVSQAIAAAIEAGELALDYTPEAALERPRDPEHGDWACTIALKLAKELGRNPREIAQVIAARIQTSELVSSVEVAGPGFINLRLSPAALQQVVREAWEQGPDFARLNVGAGRTVNVEFISANPTGPMHVGHGRWAALGNAMCNVLEHAGWQVTREFYINDAGSQMDKFGRSIEIRYRQLQGEDLPWPEDEGLYGGQYVIELAQELLAADGSGASLPASSEFRERGYQLMLGRMQALCERIGVPFHVWYSERELYQPRADGHSAIETMLAELQRGGYLYEHEGATWFRSTDFGDDKDRVLVKADGDYTYFAPDIAYHLSKFGRGSEFLINIWGADHHGYIPRMQAACTALGHSGKLTIVLGQLVNLYRGGEAVRMSKRTGEMVTFEELIEEVGPDATKYLMLARSSDQALDFDIEAATRQDASNPVYYVQYAHARICSILRKAQAGSADGAGVGTNDEPLDQPDALASGGGVVPAVAGGISAAAMAQADLTLLTHPAELDLAREFARLAEVVEGAAADLAPFRLTHYAEQLATAFHSFYTRCQVLTDAAALTAARLYLVQATRNVLALTLSLIGVSAPERM
ncbi:MAG: arginine--tRNA ligase [Coriobacteriales bacterium]|jgi:arginyl-tRNA synthetase|nr:arginine--tRNA ligase [Coriobacteriales bacterium]